MSTRRVVATLLLVGAAATAAWYSFPRTGEATAPTGGLAGAVPAAADVPETVAPSGATRSDRARPFDVESSTSLRQDRTQARPAALVGRVVDGAGRGIAGARVQWTVLTAAPAGARVSDVTTEAIEAASRTTTTSAEGRFAFPDAPSTDSESPSVVWASHAAYFADGALVTGRADAERGFELAPIELEPAEAATARVVDEAGRPVAGAVVEQRMLHVETDDEPFARARVVFARELETAADGRVVLHPLRSHESLLRARRGSLRAQPSVGHAAGLATLALHGSFGLTGAVVVDSVGVELGDARIVVTAMSATEAWPLGSLSVRPNGTFGPARFALLPDSEYVFALSGDDVEPRRVRRAAPTAGRDVRLDLATRAGHALLVHVTDDDGRAVADATVAVTWQDEVGVATRSTTTDRAGTAHVRGLPHRMVTVDVEARTFATRTAGPFLTTRSEPIELVLRPATIVRGRVSRDGRPVERFDVVWWSNDPAARTAQTFVDPLGRFELDGVPPGAVTLVAVAPEGPESAPLTLRDEDHDVPVELELPSGRPGSLRVVDGTTGEPLDRARVRLWATANDALLVERGGFEPVGTDGTFRSTGFGPRWTGLEIVAEGYAPYWTTHRAPETGPVRVGDVALYRPAAATLCVIGLDRDERSALHGWTERGNRVALPSWTDVAAARSSDAVETTLAELRPFYTDFVVELRSGERVRVGSDLVAGQSTPVALDLGSSTSLTVELLARSEPHPSPRTARVWTTASDGSIVRHERASTTSRTELTRLAGDHATVAIVDGSGDTIALGTTALRPGASTALALAPAGEHEIVVVGPDGQPVPEARVTAHLALGTGWSQATTTDARGRATLIATELPLTLSLEHAELGRAAGLALPPPLRSDEPTRVVFAAGSELELRLVDDGVPQADVWVWILDPETGDTRGDARTDAAGFARPGRFAPGVYLAYAHSPGYWPVPLEFTLEPGGVPVTVDVFRNGDAMFEVQDDGVPAGDAQVHLRYVEEFALGLEDWIASGGVASLSQELRTDASGALAVPELPRGDYEWTVVLADGRSSTGRVHVPPHGEAHVTVELR